jgi:ribulose-phosphate 3-epimerase
MTWPAFPVAIAPSLICCDLNNIERELGRLADVGVERIHVDIIDGQFSPSMPIGLETVRQARSVSNLPFDVHIMARDNEFFCRELAAASVESLCFHFETGFHIERLLSVAREKGAKAGIALMPATPIGVLEYCVEQIDFVLLMLINPGYAGRVDEKQVPYAHRKVADCRQYLDDRGIFVPIHVDGRISFDGIPDLVAAGADVLVAGTRSLFHHSGSLAANLERMRMAIASGIDRRRGAEDE